MNTETGELYKRSPYDDELRKGFIAVPEELQPDADLALGDNDSVVIDLKANTPLANFARKVNKAKRRRKMATASKRRNRR